MANSLLLLESGDQLLLESGDAVALENNGAATGIFYLLLESGDRLLLESGDAILLESSTAAAYGTAQWASGPLRRRWFAAAMGRRYNDARLTRG